MKRIIVSAHAKYEPVAESDELREGVIVDYGKDGKVMSVEVLNASEHVTEPRGIAYEPKKQIAATALFSFF